MKLLVPVLAASLCAALSLGAQAAPDASAAPLSTMQGTAHFLVLDAQSYPLQGTQLAGTCEASAGSFWKAQKHSAQWRCTVDADGVCEATITTLADPEGKPLECRGTERSTITEPGKTAEKSSYHAFFPRGVASSYTLMQKGDSWKHGDYLFKAVDSQQAFDAMAHHWRKRYYAERLARSGDGADALVSTEAAHYIEDRDYPNLTFLSVRADAPDTVRVTAVLSYTDYAPHHYTQAHFDGGSQGEQAAPLTQERESTVCTMRDLMARKCSYYETHHFDIPLALARQLASQYQRGARTDWPLHITSGSGHDRKLPVPHAEFAALVDALGR